MTATGQVRGVIVVSISRYSYTAWGDGFCQLTRTKPSSGQFPRPTALHQGRPAKAITLVLAFGPVVQSLLNYSFAYILDFDKLVEELFTALHPDLLARPPIRLRLPRMDNQILA